MCYVAILRLTTFLGNARYSRVASRVISSCSTCLQVRYAFCDNNITVK